MQLCEGVCDAFHDAGHEITVLSSSSGQHGQTTKPYAVHHVLSIDPDWTKRTPAAIQFFVGRRRRELRAVNYFRQLIKEFRPDIITIWHGNGLPRLLFQEAQQIPDVRTVYYMANYLPELPDEYVRYWQETPTNYVKRKVKKGLAPIALRTLRAEGKPLELSYHDVICVSDYVKQRLVTSGLISSQSAVIHNGIDPLQFAETSGIGKFEDKGVLRCLSAGRIVPEKGLHTVLEALEIIALDGGDSISLTIAGSGPEEYRSVLRASARGKGIAERICWHGRLPRSEMPALMQQHDVLLVPSVWEEPLSRAILEGMSSGLVVVASDTGGSREIINDGKDGLLFPANDAPALAVQLRRLGQDRELCRILAKNARQKIVADWTMERMIEQLEAYFEDAIRETECHSNHA